MAHRVPAPMWLAVFMVALSPGEESDTTRSERDRETETERETRRDTYTLNFFTVQRSTLKYDHVLLKAMT